MTGKAETVHVAWGVSRAESIRDALRLQGCGTRVIALTYALSLGPIDPPDPEARRAWFAAHTRMTGDPWTEGANAETPWTEATASSVHPVYWVCLSDAVEHAGFLEFASRMGGRPFDIVDATGLAIATEGGIAPAWSLGLLRPEDIVASGLSGKRRPFTKAESDAALADWSQLRRENAPLRVVRDGRLVSAPLTHFDAVLMAQAAAESEMLIKLVGRVLNHLSFEVDPPGQGCSDELLFARILVLGDAGALDVTGSGPGMRDYEVRRRGGAASA